MSVGVHMELQIGVIGIGGLGHLQTKTYAGMEATTVIGAADVSEEARRTFEAEFDAPAHEHYRELLHEHRDELDAVMIVTPHTLHYEQAKACIEQNLHVLLEKPMVTDIAHAVDLIESAAEQGVVLQIGYQRHFHPAFEEIRRIVRSGRIGEVHTVNCYLGQDWIDLHRDTWRTDLSLSGGGQLYDSGSHLLDALLWTTGTVPTSVTAQMDHADPGVDINSALTVRLDRDGDPTLASVGISGDGVDATPSEGYFYWGTGGHLSYIDNRIVVAEQDARTYRTEITSGTDFQSLNRRKLENFIGSIEGTVDPAVPGDVGLQVTALTEAAYQAADNERSVAVQPLIEDAYANRS